jgi:energy-coupling factor transport system permease protein
MESFEFIREISIGQYMPTGSVVHRLDPRARLLGGTILLLAMIFASHPPGLILGLPVFLLGLALARIPLRFALRGLLPPLPFIFILAILQVFINPYPDTLPIYTHIGSLAISGVDLWAGAALILRFTGLILGLSLVSFSLSTSEMIYGLGALLRPLTRLGMPVYDLVMMIQITLRFLPLLAQSMERIAKAQASRGADWGQGRGGLLKRIRRVIPLIVPMFLVSLRRAEQMALAMDARAYGIDTNRTAMVEMRFGWRDGLALGLVILVSGLIVWL